MAWKFATRLFLRAAGAAETLDAASDVTSTPAERSATNRRIASLPGTHPRGSVSPVAQRGPGGRGIDRVSSPPALQTKRLTGADVAAEASFDVKRPPVARCASHPAIGTRHDGSGAPGAEPGARMVSAGTTEAGSVPESTR